MSMPPTLHFQDITGRMQSMAKNCNNERVAMLMQYAALGSMIIMAGLTARKALKEAFGEPDRKHNRDLAR